MKYLVHLLIIAFAAIALEYILGGVHFESFGSALIFALFLSLLNVTVKPILKIIGLPLSIITLGVFSLIINTIVILMADFFVSGMNIDGFGWAFIFGIGLSALTSLLQSIFGIE